MPYGSEFCRWSIYLLAYGSAADARRLPDTEEVKLLDWILERTLLLNYVRVEKRLDTECLTTGKEKTRQTQFCRHCVR